MTPGQLQSAKSFLAETIRKTKYRAKTEKQCDFDIDTDYIMSLLVKQQGKCALTGWTLEYVRGGDWDGRNPRGATMDRIDNDKGYVKGNIQLVCGLVNNTRGKLTVREFKNICKAVTQNS